jgi:hypothetical protein
MERSLISSAVRWLDALADGSYSLSPVWQMLVTAPCIRPYHFQAFD